MKFIFVAAALSAVCGLNLEKVVFGGFIYPLTGELTNGCDKFNYKIIMEAVRAFIEKHPGDRKKPIILDNTP